METLFPILLVGGLVFAAVYHAHVRRKEREAWGSSAQRLGAFFDPGAFLFGGPSIRGTLDGVSFLVKRFHRSTGKNSIPYTRILAWVDDPKGRRIPKQLVLGADGVLAALAKTLGGEDLVVGDRTFDDAVRVRGPRGAVLAGLTPAARELAAGLVDQHASLVEDGNVRVERRGRMTDPAQLEALVRRAVRLAGELAHAPAELPARLARNARSDDVAAVREQNLRQLLGAHGATPEAREASRAALEDPAGALRLVAARALGAEGAGVLRALAESAREEPRQRAEALDALADVAEPAGITSVVEGILARKERLEGPLAVATARALVKCGWTSERRLLELLMQGSSEARVAAAEALGQVGRVTAVERLHAVAGESGAGGDLRRAARAAIDAIQSRLEGAEAGRLTVASAADGEGGLSVDPGNEGQLSLPIAPPEERASDGTGPSDGRRARTRPS